MRHRWSPQQQDIIRQSLAKTCLLWSHGQTYFSEPQLFTDPVPAKSLWISPNQQTGPITNTLISLPKKTHSGNTIRLPLRFAGVSHYTQQVSQTAVCMKNTRADMHHQWYETRYVCACDSKLINTFCPHSKLICQILPANFIFLSLTCSRVHLLC